MGYVIAAYDEGQRAEIAVKRLLPELRDDRSRGMFTREAKLLTQLRHPNIVRGLAHGEDDDGPFLAMELVLGVTLDELIAAAPAGIPVPVACRILADVCSGLAAAHELRGDDGELLGLVHRDVTPHNVVIDFEGRVLLFDFGVAKVDRSSRLSKTGEVKGKTGYMSPEQAMGDPLDPRSDLFAVGAILFELLTGRKMWAGTEMEILRSLALAEPPDLPAEFDERLRSLYRTLVARRAQDRPTSALDVAKELSDFASSSKAVGTFLDEHLPGRNLEAKKKIDQALSVFQKGQIKKAPSWIYGIALASGLLCLLFWIGTRNSDATPSETSSGAATEAGGKDLKKTVVSPIQPSDPTARAAALPLPSVSSTPVLSPKVSGSTRSGGPRPVPSTRPSSDVDPNPI